MPGEEINRKTFPGVATAMLRRVCEQIGPRGLFHLRAELARRDYDDQGTPTHDHAGTLRDQDAPAFGEQLRELL
jgi:hypothetical protein